MPTRIARQGRNRADATDVVPERLRREAGPEQMAIDSESAARMNRLLAILPEKQREILILRVVVGMSAEETAEAVGSTPGAVRVAQHRALARLKAEIDRDGARPCLISVAGRANGGDPSLNEINRTDRFLDALAAEQPVYSTDPRRGRAGHSCSPAGATTSARPPDRARGAPRDAAIALHARARGAHGATGRRWPWSVRSPLRVLCLGGFGAVVYGAGPGDALYGLRVDAVR